MRGDFLVCSLAHFEKQVSELLHVPLVHDLCCRAVCNLVTQANESVDLSLGIPWPRFSNVGQGETLSQKVSSLLGRGILKTPGDRGNGSLDRLTSPLFITQLPIDYVRFAFRFHLINDGMLNPARYRPFASCFIPEELDSLNTHIFEVRLPGRTSEDNGTAVQHVGLWTTAPPPYACDVFVNTKEVVQVADVLLKGIEGLGHVGAPLGESLAVSIQYVALPSFLRQSVLPS